MSALRRRCLIGLSALLLLGAVSAGGWATYQKLKDHRAESLLAKSRSLFLEPNKLDQAFEKAQAALQLNPENKPGLGWMAVILARAGREEALEYWRRSVAGRVLTQTDRETLIQLAMQVRRSDVAEAELAEALRQPEVSPRLFELAAKFCDATGDAPNAIRFARVWQESRPRDLDAKFILGKHLLERQTSEAEAKQLLGDVATSNHPCAREALSLLARHPNLSASEVRRVQGWLNLLPFSDPTRDFDMIDLQLRLQPEREAELTQAAIAHFSGSSGDKLIPLGQWLARRGSFEKVLQSIPEQEAFSDQGLFLICADALATLGRWKELDQWLTRAKLPLDPALADLYRARVARELGQEKQTAYYWAQAQWRASQRPEILMYIARYAQAMGEPKEAIKAYQQLSKDSAWTRSATLSLVKLFRQQKDTRSLRDLMRRLQRDYPNDLIPRNDCAYLDLLLGENVDAARTVASDLVRQDPLMLAYRTTLALARLRSSEPAGAWELYAGQRIEWDRATPGWQTIFAAVLARQSDKESARKLAAQIDQDKLLPEERALLAPLL